MSSDISETQGEVIVYEGPDGAIRVDVRLERETVWLSQKQMSELFDTSTDNVGLHLKNIFSEGELVEAATAEDYSVVQTEGRRQVRRQVKHYNLDAIISVGYHVNSKRGTQFRIWATRTLRDHLLRGYTLNERRLAERGLGEMEQAVALLSRTLTAHALVTDEGRDVLGVVQQYTRAWRLLLEYDEERLGELPARPVAHGPPLTLDEVRAAVAALRDDLATRGEAGVLFGQERFVGCVRELSQAFALAVPQPEALRIRDDVAFFQAVQAVLAKRAAGDARPEEELEHAVRQIISRAVASEGVVDIFAAAGLEKPDLSILSDEFLAEVRGMPHRNLAVELLQKLLKGEVRARRRKNVVQARSFAEMLEETIRRYTNRAIEAAQVIEELIALAKEMREANARGESLGLSEDEVAFYDALETNDSAVQVLGDETLRGIARELVETVRNNVTIDWTLRENVRAQLRVLIKRILKKHGYPPDKQEKATQTVLEQAALLSEVWISAA
jgi:hypothetical protein